MLKRFQVNGLHGRMSFDLTFHSDLNILTGKNGSGKTSLLKLMWFMLSGNIERIAPELRFADATLETDSFSLKVFVEEQGPRSRLRFDLQDHTRSDASQPPPRSTKEGADRLGRRLAPISGSSLFFPTFRRIEGGFSMGQAYPAGRDYSGYWYSTNTLDIEPALMTISRHLSSRNHQFVASIATADIVSMLTSQYANLSEQINEDHRGLSRDIEARMREHESTIATLGDEGDKLDVARRTLDAVRAELRRHSKRQEEILKPFAALSDLIGQVFQSKGILVTSRLTLGNAKEAIASEHLSAGEKQMLSFLAYNAFSQNSIIFIDEPEISLHVDWQRMLFPTLRAQGSGNQFVVATHSPFIYAQNTEKELPLDPDRGE